jgi:hypothetical protein
MEMSLTKALGDHVTADAIKFTKLEAEVAQLKTG